jgi:hypothetical protein
MIACSLGRLASAATSASCSVPAGSAAALICDTSALLDYLVEGPPDHRLFRHVIDQARTRYVLGEGAARQVLHERSHCRALVAKEIVDLGQDET